MAKSIFKNVEDESLSYMYGLDAIPSLIIHKIKVLLGNEWDSYFKFAFVRNPWDRMVSQYNYTKQLFATPNLVDAKNESAIRYREEIVKNLGKDYTFEEFLSAKCPKPLDPNWNNQHIYISDGGEVVIDYVGRFETISKDWGYVCKKLNLVAPILRINVTKHRHYSTYYNDNTRNMVYLLCKRDIELFNYNYNTSND